MKKLILSTLLILSVAACTSTDVVDMSKYKEWVIAQKLEEQYVTYDWYILKKDGIRMEKVEVPSWWSKEYSVGDTIQ